MERSVQCFGWNGRNDIREIFRPPNVDNKNKGSDIWVYQRKHKKKASGLEKQTTQYNREGSNAEGSLYGNAYL